MRLVFAVVLMFATLFPVGARAQAAAPSPPRDVLGELLEEVRGLRQAMERAATVGARIQLLVARVQLQEQRITELSRRLVAIRSEMSSLDTQAAGVSTQLAMFEKSEESAKLPPEERDQIAHMVKAMKSQLAQFDRRRQELTNEETLLQQQVSADQGRWSDVNSQLDDIERSLAAPVRK